MFNSKLIKKRIIPAIGMILSGALIYIGCAFYNPEKPEAVTVAQTDTQEDTRDNAIPAETMGDKKIIYTVEEGWTPRPDELNLAHVFPEDAESNEVSDSYAGMAFNALVRHESTWWSNVYSSAGMTPAQLAVQLGRDPSSVYSSSGEVKTFKSIRMNVINGDGTPVNLKSNIIQIMSMANVYMYYHDPDDYDAFLEYCLDLFDRSHSYSISMSSVYYCDGSCQNSNIDSEDFDEDFFAFDTNFNIDTDSSEPLDYFYEPVYETQPARRSLDTEGVILSGEARQAYEESLDYSDSGSGSGSYENEPTFDEDFAGDESDDVWLPDSEEDFASEGNEDFYDDESQEEAEAAAAQAAAESQAAAEAAAQAAAESQAAAEAAAQSQAAAEAAAMGETEMQPEEGLPAETESQVSVIRAGESRTTEASDEASGNGGYNEDEWEIAEVYGSEVVEYQQPASPSDAESDESESSDGSSSTSTTRTSTARCPGHIDLTINIRIYDLDGSKNLYTLDVYGSKADNNEDEKEETAAAEEDQEEDSEKDSKDSEDTKEDASEDNASKPRKLHWSGWGEEQRSYVDKLSNEDWYEKYGLSLSTFSFGNPLTPSEINRYMAMLPENLSETRKKVIEFALQSIGRVPYYYGGKASYAGYEGNNFGMLVDPDHSGRVLKGLDCSGWVGWVYWSVTGQHSPYESTSTLCSMGEAITLDQMQPGDIAVRTGSSAHVIMFLGWAEDGNILCIHESSAGVNNVTIAERAPSWPYYRSIFD